MRTIVPKNAKTIPPHAKRVFKGVIFDVYQWQQEMFDGSRATFEMLKRPDTIIVMAIKDGKLVVINEQQPDGPRLFGLPGGRHDAEGETELHAAKRELNEETGMRFRNWKLVRVMQKVKKIDWLIYLYIATGFEGQQEPRLDSGERIDVHLMDYPQVLTIAKSDKNLDLPLDILERAGSIEGLLALPEYRP